MSDWIGKEITGLQCLAGLGEPPFDKFLGPRLVIARDEELQELRAFLRFKSAPCFYLPASRSQELTEPPWTGKAFQQAALRGLSAVFCASPLALLKKTFFPKTQQALVLQKNVCPPDFKTLGFQEKEFAKKPGEFARRGFLIDILPPSYQTPIRVELDGDRIDSLHILNPDLSRREEIQKVSLLSLKEWEPAERQALCRFLKDKGPQDGGLAVLARGEIPPGWEDLVSVLSEKASLDFFPASKTEIWLKDPEKLQSSFYRDSFLKTQKLSPALSTEDLFRSWEILDRFPSVVLREAPLNVNAAASAFASAPASSPGPPLGAARETSPKNPSAGTQTVSYPCRRFQSEPAENMSFSEQTKRALRELAALPVRQLVFLSQTDEEERDLKQALHSFRSASSDKFARSGDYYEGGDFLETAETDKTAVVSRQPAARDRAPAEENGAAAINGAGPSHFGGKTVLFLRGRLLVSFVNEGGGAAYIQARDGLPQDKTRRKPTGSFDSFWQKASALDFSRMKKGELVVHRKHGVAQFQELESVSAGGVSQDYLILGYKKGDRLLLPAYRAGEVKKYALEAVPFQERLLDRLGDPRRWEKKKAGAKKHIEAVAVELLNLYRARKNLSRPPFQPGGEILGRLEESFPFQETEGQKKALSEIFQDMSRPQPMDRLLCGDVGFGKTEPALRTAVRAAESGFQVCILTPTTILSLQHYERFTKRLEKEPLEIAVLNRFLKTKEKEELLRKVKEGRIDILIATHSVFSPRLFFKNLGLLIVDEEHRFGVRQKEYLRRMKKGLDTLSLSATPIPRTLSMALSGMRDISVIPDPPLLRKPVQTLTTVWDRDLIRRACEREKERAGQILFVHNRIQSLPQKEEELREILFDFKIAVAHGRMPAAELETIVYDFFHKKYDLLLSTNIIESGMDIPAANTLFIDRAHEAGLSRAYQLKGRVGRGPTQAYCYFITPSKISEAAQKRLRLLEKHSRLGAGFHLALYDLESRGAGEIFGAEQSGHLSALGQELFFELMREKLEEKEEVLEPEIQMPVSTGIPSDYMPDKPLRLLYYKSLSDLKSEEELQEQAAAMERAHGVLPRETAALFELLALRLICRRILVKSLKAAPKNLYIVFQETGGLDRAAAGAPGGESAGTKSEAGGGSAGGSVTGSGGGASVSGSAGGSGAPSRDKILSLIRSGLWTARGDFALSAPLDPKEDLFAQTKALLKSFLS